MYHGSDFSHLFPHIIVVIFYKKQKVSYRLDKLTTCYTRCDRKKKVLKALYCPSCPI